MKAVTFTKEDAIGILWEIATKAPEDTRGNLRDQIRACKVMYCAFGYEPAWQRLIAGFLAASSSSLRVSFWQQLECSEL